MPGPAASRPAVQEPPDDDVSIQDQTLIFRAQDPAGREDDATSASEPEPVASASEPAPEPAAEPEAAAEPEPEPDVTLITTAPADDQRARR